jgi:endo-1,4-beta-xylanase
MKLQATIFLIGCRTKQMLWLVSLSLMFTTASYTQLAEGHDKFLGNVYSTAQLPKFADYWNQVTPENAGKWGSAEPTRDVMNWTTLDAAYNFAKNNGFPFRFHVLVWGNQQPAWIENLPTDEQLDEIEEWFNAVADRYPDLDYVEVVNEPLHDPPNQPGNGGGNYIEALGGSGDTGWDWVLNAFRLARDYFSDAKLMINEYSVENSSSDAGRYLSIIKLLQAEDLIDAIGVQGHAFSTRVSAATIISNLNRLATSGLPIQVTEFDIDGPTDEVQLQDYQRLFPAFWEHPAVQGITFWGWRPGMWRTSQGAYLVQSNGTERPALVWLREYLEDQLASIDNSGEPPKDYTVLTNYPNPFNPQTTIEYSLEKPGLVSVEIFDMTGKKIKTLVSENQSAAVHRVVWDGTSDSGVKVASGVYCSRLQLSLDSESIVKTNKMLLLK